MFKLPLSLLATMTSVTLFCASPSMAANEQVHTKFAGEKERQITESGQAAIEAEKQGKTNAEFSFPTAVELYSDDELNDLIAANKHLQRVRADDCQLVQDIQARAELVKLPSYQFLWGDMLAWGVCVKPNAELGIYYMRAAAMQGQPRALEQLGRYYVQGRFVQQDIERAIPLFLESSKLGFLPAKLQLADLLVRGYGSPFDYKDAYTYLYSATTGSKKTHQQIELLLAQLETLMPPSVVISAKRAAKYN